MIIIFTMILGIQGSFERLFSPPKKPILRISSLARDQKFDNKPGGEEKTLLPGAPLVAIGAQKHDSIPVSKCQLFQILFINCSSNGGGPH